MVVTFIWATFGILIEVAVADAYAHVAQRLSLSVFTNLCQFKKKINMVLYFLNVGVSQRKKHWLTFSPVCLVSDWVQSSTDEPRYWVKPFRVQLNCAKQDTVLMIKSFWVK